MIEFAVSNANPVTPSPKSGRAREHAFAAHDSIHAMGAICHQVVLTEDLVEILRVFPDSQDAVFWIHLPQFQFFSSIIHGARDKKKLRIFFDAV
jgi:hypothetical protein